jgi:hypothetical protein
MHSPTTSTWQQIDWQQQLIDIPALSNDDDGRYHETVLAQLHRAGAPGLVMPMPFALPYGDTDMPIAWLRRIQPLVDARGHLTSGGTAVQHMAQAQPPIVQRTYSIDSERYNHDAVRELQRLWHEFN